MSELTTRQIEVTAEDLRDPKRSSARRCTSCPVALAINRHLKTGLTAFAAKTWIRIERGDKMVHDTDAPECLAQHITDIDVDNTKVRPFSFPLTLPTELWRDQ